MMIVNSCNDFTWSKGCINFRRTVWLIRPFQISPMEESIFSNSFHGGIDFIKLFPWTLRHFGKVSTMVFITSRLVLLSLFIYYYFFFIYFIFFFFLKNERIVRLRMHSHASYDISRSKLKHIMIKNILTLFSQCLYNFK